MPKSRGASSPRAARAGLTAALDQLEPATEREAREVFDALHATGRADTLREAQPHDCLTTWVHQACTLAETWSVTAQLRRWLGWLPPGSTGRDDVARLADVQEPPELLQQHIQRTRTAQ